MIRFDQQRFERKLSKALDQARLVLEVNKNVTNPGNLPHQYDDKYHLTNYLSNSAILSVLIALGTLGIDLNILNKLKEWSVTHEVSLRFQSQEKCEFVKETKREVENPHRSETSVSGSFGGFSIQNKSYTAITEYHYLFQSDYSISAFRGVGSDSSDIITFVGWFSHFSIISIIHDHLFS